MVKATLLPLLALFVCLCISGVAQAKQIQSQNRVVTTVYPLTYLAQRLAPTKVQVICPVPEDADPLHWQPSRKEVFTFQHAALVILNGVGLETWVSTTTLYDQRLLDVGLTIKSHWINYESAASHSHGPGGAHSHTGLDSHTWLDPIILLTQAEAIHKAFLKQWPHTQDEQIAAWTTLQKDLLALDASLKQLGKLKLVASHPAYNYLAKRYGWTIRNLDLDPDAELSSKQLSHILRTAKRADTSILLWESEPIGATLITLKQHGITPVVFSPAEQPIENGDYLSMMKQNIQALVNAAKTLKD